MNLQSFLILLVIFILLALAILFICQNGGWQGGCGGNCASCHQHCNTPEKKKSGTSDDATQEKSQDE